MNVLITGASGFVGRHLIVNLTAAGHNVTGIGHTVATNLSCQYNQVDLLDYSAVQKQDFSSTEGIIHLAGLAAVGPSFLQPRQYIDHNAGMQINLFESLLKQRVSPRVVIVSSGMLYQPHTLPLTEQSPIDTPNPYAVSKLTQEMLANYYRKRGFEIIIARPFNHMGPGQAEGFIAADLAKQIVDVEKVGHGIVRAGDFLKMKQWLGPMLLGFWAQHTSLELLAARVVLGHRLQ